MAKKKSRNNDDFNQIPEPLLSQKTGDLLSFRLAPPEIPPLIEDVCEVKILPIKELGIIKKKGRKAGVQIQYGVDNLYNYRSQSQRYDRAIAMGVLPVRVRTEGGRTCYLFCSSTEPGGFYETCIEEKDLFLSFTVNQLFIICPRPFNLNDLSGLDTNAEFVVWTQLQGRNAFVFPNDQSVGTLNPVISIIGERTPQDPPILLLAEAEGSTSIFDILAIDTTISDRFLSIHGIDNPRISPNYIVPCALRILGGTPNTGSCLSSSTLISAIWNNPRATTGIIGFVVQFNDGGVWNNDFASLSARDSFEAIPGTTYRILTFYKLFDNSIITESCALRLPSVKAITTDAVSSSGIDGILLSKQYTVLSLVKDYEDSIGSASGSDGLIESRQYAVSSLTKDYEDSIGSASGSDGLTESRQYALAGIIAG